MDNFDPKKVDLETKIENQNQNLANQENEMKKITKDFLEGKQISEAVQLKLKNLVQEIGEQKEVIRKIEQLERSSKLISLRNEKYILNLAKHVHKSKYGISSTFVEQHSALLLGSASPEALCSAA